MSEKNIIRIILLIVAGALLGLGVFLMGHYFKERGFYETTDAVIVDIVEDVYIDIDDEGSYSETDYYVYVDYEVNGVLYEYVPLNSYDITMHVGKVIKINYDKRDPSKVGGKNVSLVGSLVCMGVGSVFAVAGVVMGRSGSKHQDD